MAFYFRIVISEQTNYPLFGSYSEEKASYLYVRGFVFKS